MLVLAFGIIAGTLTAGTLGQILASMMIPGVSSIKFVVNPLTAYILCPMALIAAVTITIWVSGISIKQLSSLKITAE